jgi:2,3-bisphosphoglycerate-independent phosphoglycerate mutase
MNSPKIENKVILMILDGWGVAKSGPGNYIDLAKTPNFDSYIKNYANSLNKASGNAVGLPKGVQGNSEVGHLHMGAGRIVWQPFEKINQEINNGSFFNNKKIIKAILGVKKKNSSLHLMGLCSDEGVHSHLNHLFSILKLAKKYKVNKILIHFFADGRDVPERSAKKYIRLIEKQGIGKIATVIGRYYAMDRDQNYDRTQKAYDMLTLGSGFKAKSATQAIDKAYKRDNKTDYYIEPTIIKPNFSPIKENDTVIFFNFRTDRPRQLVQSFVSKNFKFFKRNKFLKVDFFTMTNISKNISANYFYDEQVIKNNLGEIISKNNLKQLRLAETEKYAHVTYFFNSQIEKPYKGEERILIPSLKVPSYDLKPEMSAKKIASEAVRQIKLNKYDFILINFANCDLVGHSAKKKAIIKAVETVDQCAAKIVNAAKSKNYTVIITADHGSAEEKLYKNGLPKPAHSSNPVNFILITKGKFNLKNGGQSDVAPTILNILGIKKPKEMTGVSLLDKIK